MFARLGRGVVRHPWWTILAWIVVAAGLIAFAPELKSSSDQEDFLPSKYESIQAGKLAATAFPSADQKTSPAMIVVKRKDGGKLTPADQKKVAGVAAALQAKKIPGVTKVAATPAAKDGSIQLIAAPLPNDYTDTKAMDTAKDAIKKLRTESTAQLRGSPLTFGVTGDMASTVDNEKSDQQTMALIGIATIALIIVLLGIIFRSPLASILPIIVVLAVSMVSNAVTAMVGNAFGLNFDKGFDMIVMIVLYGIGTDYILFLLFRYRERLRLGEDKKTAMINSVERVGEAIASAMRRCHRRLPGAAARLVQGVRRARPAARHRGRRDAGHLADPGPGGRLAARPGGVLAVQGVEEGAQARPLGQARQRRGGAPSWPRSPRGWCSSRSPPRRSASRPTTTSAPARRRTPSRPRR